MNFIFQAGDIRRKAFDQLLCEGNSAPFLALLGVSLASGSGIITKELEVEQICWEIRRAVSNTGLARSKELTSVSEDHDWSLEDFRLGGPIAKGCAAVIYSARCVSDDEESGQFPLAIKIMSGPRISWSGGGHTPDPPTPTLSRIIPRDATCSNPCHVAL